MTPWQECAGSFPAVSYGSSLGSRNVGEVSRVAVLNRDLKGLGFPKVTTESGKAVTAFSYTWFTWPVVEFLKMHYLGSALTSPKSFKTARDCACDSLVKFHITFVQLPDDYKMRG